MVIRLGKRSGALTLRSVIAHVSGSFYGVLYTIYLIQELHLSPFLLGVVISAGGVGSLIGAALAAAAARIQAAASLLVHEEGPPEHHGESQQRDQPAVLSGDPLHRAATRSEPVLPARIGSCLSRPRQRSRDLRAKP